MIVLAYQHLISFVISDVKKNVQNALFPILKKMVKIHQGNKDLSVTIVDTDLEYITQKLMKYVKSMH